MAIKVRTKSEVPIEEKRQTSYQPTNPLRIPAITGATPRTQDIIIRATKIMLMDIRMLLHPKQTKDELETYSQFANMAYGRK
jgi:hypothetical protein